MLYSMKIALFNGFATFLGGFSRNEWVFLVYFQRVVDVCLFTNLRRCIAIAGNVWIKEILYLLVGYFSDEIGIQMIEIMGRIELVVIF